MTAAALCAGFGAVILMAGAVLCGVWLGAASRDPSPWPPLSRPVSAGAALFLGAVFLWCLYAELYARLSMGS